MLSHESFESFAGTETYIATVADELAILGHLVSITAHRLGAIAAVARSRGHRVLPLAERLDPEPNLIIASDLASLYQLAERHPEAVRVFVAHSADFLMQFHPRLPGLCQATIVMNDRVGRTVGDRAEGERVVRLRQPIDLRRFRPLKLGGPPGSVLLLSNYVTGERGALIERVCRAAGWRVQHIGVRGTVTESPETVLAGTQVAIGLGRSALEAMAAGRATYVYGTVGGDGWVTPETYPAMEADGFAGTGRPDFVLDETALATDLARWEPSLGEVARDLASAHHHGRDHVLALLALARQLEPTPPPRPQVVDELAYLIRQSFRLDGQRAGYLAEVERLQLQLGDAASDTRDLQRELDLLRATAAHQRASLNSRAVRTALRLVAPLRRWRSRRAG